MVPNWFNFFVNSAIFFSYSSLCFLSVFFSSSSSKLDCSLLFNTYASNFICSSFTAGPWVLLGVSPPLPAGLLDFFVFFTTSSAGVAFKPTSIYALESKQLLRGSFKILKESREYSLKFKSASPKTPLVPEPTVNLDYIYSLTLLLPDIMGLLPFSLWVDGHQHRFPFQCWSRTSHPPQLCSHSNPAP